MELDALVSSGKDEAERYQPGQLDPDPRLVVTTSGKLGGWAQPGGPYNAAPLPPNPRDAYGAGDCFAAGLAFALGAGLEGIEALDFAARCGAGALAGPGVHAEPVAAALKTVALGRHAMRPRRRAQLRMLRRDRRAELGRGGLRSG